MAGTTMIEHLLDLAAIESPLNIVTDAAAGGAFDMLAEKTTEGFNSMFQAMTMWWIGNDTADVTQGDAGTLSTRMQTIVQPITITVAIISVLIASAKMVLSRSAQPAEEVFRGLLTLVVVSGAGLAAVALLTQISDEFSSYIMSQAGAEKFEFSAGSTISTALLFMLGTVGIIVATMQWVLMLSRDAILVLFAGLLPLAAAGTASRTGQQFFSRVTGWLLALILYKPVAAIIYWVAMRLVRDSQDLTAALSGLTLMSLSIIALPALMRLIVPAVGPAMGRGGGAMAVGTAVATGAVMVASGGSAAPAVAAAAPAAAGAVNAAGSSPVPQS